MKSQRQHMTHQQMKAQETKELIWKTAEGLINKMGTEKVTIKEICRTANVSVGTFYYHYKSKVDILLDHRDVLDKVFLEWIEKEFKPESVVDCFMQFWLYYARQNETIGPGLETRIVMHKQARDDERKRQQFLSWMDNYIEEKQKEHKVKDDKPAREITDLFYIVLRGFIFEWCVRYKDDMSLVEMVKDGIIPYIDYFVLEK